MARWNRYFNRRRHNPIDAERRPDNGGYRTSEQHRRPHSIANYWDHRATNNGIHDPSDVGDHRAPDFRRHQASDNQADDASHQNHGTSYQNPDPAHEVAKALQESPSVTIALAQPLGIAERIAVTERVELPKLVELAERFCQRIDVRFSISLRFIFGFTKFGRLGFRRAQSAAVFLKRAAIAPKSR